MIDLASHLSRVNLGSRAKVFNTPTGLFIWQGNIEHIAALVNKSVRESHKGVLLSNGEVKGILASSGEYYLPQTPQSLIGYILENFVLEGAPQRDERALSCRIHLLKTDPIFGENPYLHVPENKGDVAEFETRGKRILVEDHAFSQYVARMKASNAMRIQIRSKFPVNLRDFLSRLYTEIKTAQVAQRLNTVSQTLNHDFRDAEYLTNHGWIYVLEWGKILKTCYEVGKISEKGYKLKKD